MKIVNSFGFKAFAVVALFCGIGVGTYAGCDVVIGDTQISNTQYRNITKKIALGELTQDEVRPLMADGNITHREMNTLYLSRHNLESVDAARARLAAAL